MASISSNFDLILASDQNLVVPIIGLPQNVTVTGAMLVIKNSLSDDDSVALLSIQIPDGGTIVNNVQDQSALITFGILATQAVSPPLSAGSRYYWAVKILLSDGRQTRPVSATGSVLVSTAGVTTIL